MVYPSRLPNQLLITENWGDDDHRNLAADIANEVKKYVSFTASIATLYLGDDSVGN